MPMPHRIQMQVIKRRLVGKDGSERTSELRAILAELPGYRNGPYADIRKWVQSELAVTRVRSRVVHRDSLAVRREGAAQVALVGAPNAGKSSLLQALSQIQIRTGDYAFTTTRPVPALTPIHDVLIQLVEIPGLLRGAHGGRGGGRALLGVLRGADGLVLCHDASAAPDGLRAIRGELEAAGIELPTVLAATKVDEATAGDVARLRFALPELHVVEVSVLDEQALDALRDAIWTLTGLVRVFLRRPGDEALEAVALRPPATVVDVAATVHEAVARECRGARVSGLSARFEGQRVGRSHVLEDGDVVEIVMRG